MIFDIKAISEKTKSTDAVIKILPTFEPPDKIDLQDLYSEPLPMDFVLPGLLAGTVGAIVSPGGAGKSMYAVQAATAIAGAEDLLELGVVQGQVVYLPAEDPVIALHHRFYALAQLWDIDQRKTVRENFNLYSLIGREPDLFTNHWFYWLESLLVDKRVMFMDTLRRFHKLEENDSGQMSEVIGRLESMAWETGCSIVFLHHTSKAAALGGQGDMQQASRGSSVLVDNVRWQMFLSGVGEKEAKEKEIDLTLRKFFVKAGVSKQNYGAPEPDRYLRRVAGGVLMPAQFATSFVTKKKDW